MRTIDVDDEVYAFIQKNAIAYVDTCPNDTLRRQFGLDKKALQESSRKRKNGSRKKRAKRPKTDLRKLLSSGHLLEGQKLYLYDYQDQRLEGYEAILSGNSLASKGQMYSMSELARIFLQDYGFSTTSVRGPAHWRTETGQSVKELWDKYLEEEAQ